VEYCECKGKLVKASLAIAHEIDLQLRVGLQEWAEFLCQHDVALNLELSLHESRLWVQFVEGEVNEIIVADRERRISFAGWCALSNDCSFQVQSCGKSNQSILANYMQATRQC
jgi:hypothetical protein